MWQGLIPPAYSHAVLHLNEEVAAEVGHLAQLLDGNAVLPIAQPTEPATELMLWGVGMPKRASPFQPACSASR